MLLAETRYQHVVLKDNIPTIAGTTMKVIELVLDKIAYGWSPEELQFNHPYLTMGQIHSALAYYWDHIDELDRDIEKRLERVDEFKRKLSPAPLIAKLKESRIHPA